MMTNSDTQRIDFQDFYQNFSPRTDVPNLRKLCSIQIQPGRADAETDLSDECKAAITSSIDTIEKACLTFGFEPLLVDFSLLMDERTGGDRGRYGYYHSFFSVNTEYPTSLESIYLDAIYNEHRSSKSDSRHSGYESLVSHRGMYEEDVLFYHSPAATLQKHKVKLQKYKNKNHIGAYRFEVTYVKEHTTRVEDGIDIFITNLGRRLRDMASPETKPAEFAALPFRRAQFQPVGELKDLVSETTGTPGGVLFLFLRNTDSPGNLDKRRRNLFRHLHWLMTIAAIGEAYAPIQERFNLMDKATSSYGMAHPLKHRWGELKSTASQLNRELRSASNLPARIKERAKLLQTQTQIFGEWVELAYLLYYSSTFSIIDAAKQDSIASTKIFVDTKNFDLHQLISQKEERINLLGERLERQVKIELPLNAIQINAKSASKYQTRLPDAIYRQFLFEVISNSRNHGSSKSDGYVEIEISKDTIEGDDVLVFKNPFDRLKLPKKLYLGDEDWHLWADYSAPGGLSFLANLLRWSDAGGLYYTIDFDEHVFKIALRLNGLELN